jgi:cytochrome b
LIPRRSSVSKSDLTGPSRLRVWDRPVRLLHWSLVASVAGAWITRHRLDDVHAYWGYAALCIVGLRLSWGLVGGRYARFTQFVRPWQPTWAYLRGVIAGHAPRYIGHNPLGGWMVVALMSCLGLLGFTGWLYTTDMFWGYGWLANLHWGLAWALLALVALHVSGVVFTSVKHRENLVRAMLTGNKPPAGPTDVA